MPEIKLLPPHVSDLIAAGEVVERPASVVKELVENAIDAGASSVTVEILGGGMHYIRITDNGCGIPPEQCATAFLRHATSKLRTQTDLEAIGTLGFRGEALAAISAVSRVELLTRTMGAPLGASLQLEGGVVQAQEETGCPEGTTLIVRDLFFNTPARLKFMKRDSAEGAAVFTVVQHLALSHPELSFRFLREGREELLTPGDSKTASALYAVLGREAALGLLPCPGYGEDIRVEGYVSRPACCRGTRAAQYFFVNGRFVKSRTMTAALEQAYANTKMVGRFPACVLYLTCKLSSVDVNVHPAKTEVKFTDERRLFDAVYYAVKSVLEAESGHKQAILEEKRPKPQRSDTVSANQTYLRGMAAERSPMTLRASAVQSSYEREITPWQAATSRNAAELLARQREKRDVGIVMEALELQRSGRVQAADTPLSPELAWAGEPEPRQSRPAKAWNAQPRPSRSRPAAVPGGDDDGMVTARSSAATPPETVADTTPPEAVADTKPPEEAGTAPPEQALTTPAESGTSPEEGGWRLAGEVLRTYIIAERGDTVYLIDKHAAHERMNFDRMRAADYAPMSQLLLTPAVVRLPPAEAEALLGALELLARFGFEAEDFGGGALLVRQAPDYLDAEDVERTLSEIAGELLRTGTADAEAARDRVLHTMACKAAIKGGWRSEPEELAAVAEAVLSGRVRYCPHGRPVAIELTRRALEKQFGRIQ